MRLRRCDRYLLRQMLGPFALALAGLALFIVLNLILRLSELMVDRGIGVTQLLRLLILWMPELIAWAIPMAALFAIFLGLGRMAHDREIMALESIGVSLRRILLPLLIASIGMSFVTFAVYNWAMPVSKDAAQRTYREILFTQSVPRISANTFFTASNNQYFYVRQYDADDGAIHDVLIYDVSGRLFPQAESKITIVTADSGIWTDQAWYLENGRMVGFDQDGALIYSGTFEELFIPVGQTADQIWAQSKSPSEMGIRELIERIERARTSGLPINEMRVELHQRFALPLSTLLFVLVAGTVSMMFGTKNRSTGIIIGLLIIGLYQGTYFYLQALGRRGAMNPVLAAWAPDVLFGLIGLLLFIRVDRLASRDTWNRLRSRLPFLTALLSLVLLSFAGQGQDIPLHLECDDLFISTDQTLILAQGNVHAKLDDVLLQADALQLNQTDNGGQWHLAATGRVTLDTIDFALTGDQVDADLLILPEKTRTLSLEALGFGGESAFIDSSGTAQSLYFHGDSGRIAFTDSGDLELVEIRDGEVTTCNCCDRPFKSQPYTIRANRLLFYPERMIVAFGLTGRLGGLPVLWLPVYVQPLEDTLESPLFPAIGNSALRGWFLKWNVPFYFSDSLYGSILFDYFSRYQELGGGLTVRYATAMHSGNVSVYAFPAVVGDSTLRFSLDHTVALSESWRGSASVDYALQGESETFGFRAQASGTLGDWSLTSSAIRSWKEEGDIITQRLPEFSLTREAIDIGTFSLHPSFSAGWVREWQEKLLTSQATRLQASVDTSVKSFHMLGAAIRPSFALGSTLYSGAQEHVRTSLTLSVPVTRDVLSVTYHGTFVAGKSPFDFDAIEAQSRIDWQLNASAQVGIHIEGGFDLQTLVQDPLTASFSWGTNPDWQTTATYDIEAASLQGVVVRMSWRADAHDVSWSLPFDMTTRSLGPLDFEISSEMGSSQVALSGVIDQGQLDSAQGSLVIQGKSGWGAKLSSEFDANTPATLSSTRYGLFRDIGDCLRIGIERGNGEIWIYGSILAFPEAILRYAPESASLQIGE